MASSSSSSSNYSVVSGPVEDDVLWMQKNHVSQHIWNGADDRKLKIKRVASTYMRQEEIPQEIIHLLELGGFFTIMNLGNVKINEGLINAFIERWRLKTHIFHLRCGECTITLEDVSVLLGLYVDVRALIGNTSMDWEELCEELLGVRPDEDAIEGNSFKLSWLASHFVDVNNFNANQEDLQMFARSWILRFIKGVLFVDRSSKRVAIRYLQFFRDFREYGTYAWGAAALAFLYREMCTATDYNVKSISGYTLLIQLWAFERCSKLAHLLFLHNK